MAVEGVTGTLYQANSAAANNFQAGAGSQDITAADIKSEANTSEVRKVQGGQKKESQDMAKNDEQLSRKIKTALSRANSNMRSRRTRCEFAYHEETNRISIKIYDRETKEVIREIPPEETLEMIERLWELAGLLIDEKR